MLICIVRDGGVETYRPKKFCAATVSEENMLFVEGGQRLVFCLPRVPASTSSLGLSVDSAVPRL